MALSDLLTPRLVEMGKIKIGGLGEERTSDHGKKWRLPRKDDHFTITTLHRSGAGDLITDKVLMDELIKDYGDPDGKLRRLPVVLLSDEIDDVIQASWLWYAGKKVWARSDGKHVTWYGDPKTMRIIEPREEDWRAEFAELRDSKKNPLFKLHTVLNCVIVSKNSRWGGVYKLRTTSRITGEQIYGSLLHIAQLTQGYLRGVPIYLVVRPMQVSPNGIATTVYVIHAELRGPDLLTIQNQVLQIAEREVRQTKQLAAVTREYKKLLAPPGAESEDEAADVQEEFHPEVSDSSIGAATSNDEPTKDIDDPLLSSGPTRPPSPAPASNGHAAPPDQITDAQYAEIMRICREQNIPTPTISAMVKEYGRTSNLKSLSSDNAAVIIARLKTSGREVGDEPPEPYEHASSEYEG